MSDSERHSDELAERRWRVHVGLIATLIAAVVVLLIYRGNNTVHGLIGVAFVGLVVVHLIQRQRSVSRLAASLRPGQGASPARRRQATSDALLAFLVLNVLVSGFWNVLTGNNTPLPLPVFIGWHGLSSVLLVAYVIVHVLRRAKRLRHSHVR